MSNCDGGQLGLPSTLLSQEKCHRAQCTLQHSWNITPEGTEVSFGWKRIETTNHFRWDGGEEVRGAGGWEPDA